MMAKVGATIIGRQLIRNNLKQGSVLFSPFNCLVNCQRSVTTAINPDWDYETERRTFQLKTPEYYNFARDVIDKWADKEKVRTYCVVVDTILIHFHNIFFHICFCNN